MEANISWYFHWTEYQTAVKGMTCFSFPTSASQLAPMGHEAMSGGSLRVTTSVPW